LLGLAAHTLAGPERPPGPSCGRRVVRPNRHPDAACGSV